MNENVTPANWPHYVPDNDIVYVIPDLHGHLKAHDVFFETIKQNIKSHPDKNHVAIYLGDYIDRGPRSRQLIDRLIEIQTTPPQGLTPVFLAGNHEGGMLAFLEDPHGAAKWLDYGGIETAQSYGIDFSSSEKMMPAARERLRLDLLKTLPAAHYQFLSLLNYMYVLGDYAFVHAGIRPGVPLSDQDPADLTMIRESFLSSPNPHEKCIVHGHTIMPQIEIMMNRISLDTGYFQSGVLSCAILQDNQVFLEEITDVEDNHYS